MDHNGRRCGGYYERASDEQPKPLGDGTRIHRQLNLWHWCRYGRRTDGEEQWSNERGRNRVHRHGYGDVWQGRVSSDTRTNLAGIAEEAIEWQ